jgi:hypothetical protein
MRIGLLVNSDILRYRVQPFIDLNHNLDGFLHRWVQYFFDRSRHGIGQQGVSLLSNVITGS